jgi:hypothetical protein
MSGGGAWTAAVSSERNHHAQACPKWVRVAASRTAAERPGHRPREGGEETGRGNRTIRRARTRPVDAPGTVQGGGFGARASGGTPRRGWETASGSAAAGRPTARCWQGHARHEATPVGRAAAQAVRHSGGVAGAALAPCSHRTASVRSPFFARLCRASFRAFRA